MCKIASGLLTAVALAGCGGSSNSDEAAFTVRASTTMSEGPTNRARFVTAVNRICREGWPTILDNFRKYSSWQSHKRSEAELYAKTVRLTYTASLDFHIFDTIRQELKAPRGEAADVEEMLGAMQLAVERGQREQGLHIGSPEELETLFADYNRVARADGYRDCLVVGQHVPQKTG